MRFAATAEFLDERSLRKALQKFVSQVTGAPVY